VVARERFAHEVVTRRNRLESRRLDGGGNPIDRAGGGRQDLDCQGGGTFQASRTEAREPVPGQVDDVGLHEGGLCENHVERHVEHEAGNDGGDVGASGRERCRC
jgi:hypothetical protein